MPITVRQLFEAGREALSLTLDSGADFLDCPIVEEALNRPGLALAGFFHHFAFRRVQVLGLAEYSYLKSLSPEDLTTRLGEMFKRRIPAVVITRGRHTTDEMRQLSVRYRIPIMRTTMITGRFINEATLLISQLTAPSTRVHGTMVDIQGTGVLIEGEPGIGKSEMALTLIQRGHSLVADDITVLRRTSEQVIMASAVEITRYHMEIRGLGIIHVPSLFGIASMRRETALDLIVRLQRPSPEMESDRSGLTPQTRDVLGVRVPLITLPVAAGRDLAHVVEVAALNQKLKHLGHDAAKELDEKLIQTLIGRKQHT
ncbi:MAG: HPr(Ser) kinase/phosphatase [Verrucomicrobia bacterium]|nr:HPr(Ser) kinase/phosphatase [Kiritimatiellia bacterium]MCO6400500.1 HPr(Ser) kinase/phosphatase [Verrucomicrobiota bacterium]